MSNDQNLTAEQQKQAEATMQEVIARSATDPSFREKLKADPRSAIEEHTGLELKEAPDVAFVESGDESKRENEQTVILPDPVDSEAELSAEELEAVSGGTEVAGTAALVGAAFVAGTAVGLAVEAALDE